MALPFFFGTKPERLAYYLPDIYLYDMPKEGGTTEYALLGLLSIRPMSGYDIRQFIPLSIGHFWSESYGQIYPSLKRMTLEGLVEKRTESGKGRPDRHVYSPTAQGMTRLAEWLALPATPDVLRYELLLKMFFGAHARPEVSRRHVVEAMARAQHLLQIYAALRKKLSKERAGDPQLPFCLITLNRGRHDNLAALRWCREALEELDRIDHASTTNAAKRKGSKRRT